MKAVSPLLWSAKMHVLWVYAPTLPCHYTGLSYAWLQHNEQCLIAKDDISIND